MTTRITSPQAPSVQLTSAPIVNCIASAIDTPPRLPDPSARRAAGPMAPRQDLWPYRPQRQRADGGAMAHVTARDSSRPGPAAELPEQAVAGLLAAAVAAPSMHNTQPWRFRVRHDPQVIELYADPARTLKYGDPRGRAVHIACGAALFNLRLAAAVAGRQPVVTLLPDPGQPLLVATVRLAGPCRAQPAERELYAAIARRHTNRRPFSGRRVRRRAGRARRGGQARRCPPAHP